jgi:hypothetical protein
LLLFAAFGGGGIVLLVQWLNRVGFGRGIDYILAWPLLLDVVIAALVASANFATAYAGYRVTVTPISPDDIKRRRKMETIIWSSFEHFPIER